MTGETQKVVVIQDASREISSSALEWALTGLRLKPEDELTLLAVLHQVNTPSTFPFMGARTLMGYKSKVNSSSIFGANNTVVKEAVQRKKEEYENKEELIRVNELYESKQINFSVLVVPASSPKLVAKEAVKSLGATWIILDRHMKKDKKYYLENLSCGISRMKSNNSIEQLRGPKMRGSNYISREGSKNNLVSYEEMLPGKPEDEDLFSLDLSPNYSKSITKNQKGDTRARTSSDNESLNASNFPNSSSKENLSSAHSSPNKANLGTLLSLSHELKASPVCPIQEANSKGQGPANIGSREIERTGNVERTPATSQRDHIKGVNNDDECFEIAVSVCQPNERLDGFACSCGNARPKIEWKKDFKYSELRVATEKFSKRNFLSEGGFGFVYKGELMNGQKIAVKQYKPASLQGEREFKKEVDVLSKARHKNVVMLLGSCSEGNHRLLVYEFVCNGSLDQHLSGKSSEVISWPARLKVALGAAKGLQYLHSNNIIHRDMRPNNILVTHDYEPMLGDFGLARICEGPDHSSDSRLVGTIGYLAPEYAETGKTSKKTDVYSFGVVLLELLTGRSTTDRQIGEGSLVEWARPLLKERKYPELIDPMILDSFDVHLHELFWMVRLTEKCLNWDPEKRLHLDKVVYVLECVNKGQNFIDIEDFSPPHSNLMEGKWDTNEAARESEGSISREKVKDKTRGPEQGSRADEMAVQSGPSSAQTSSPRSPYTPTSYESSSSGSRSSRKMRRKSRSQSVFYGEMLI